MIRVVRGDGRPHECPSRTCMIGTLGPYGIVPGSQFAILYLIRLALVLPALASGLQFSWSCKGPRTWRQSGLSKPVFDLVSGHGGVVVAQAIETVDLHWGLHCQGLSLLTATEVTA